MHKMNHTIVIPLQYTFTNTSLTNFTFIINISLTKQFTFASFIIQHYEHQSSKKNSLEQNILTKEILSF